MLMNDIRFFYCLSLGVVLTLAVYLVVQYFTGIKYLPVKNIARLAQSGAAISILTGVSYGMLSAAIPIIFIAAVATFTYFIFGGGLLGVYGIVAASLGLISMTGVIMSADTFGPIVDNASGIAQMASLEKEADQSLDELDACGNVTKAITKGFSMTAAVMTSIGLLFAFISEAFRIQTGSSSNVNRRSRTVPQHGESIDNRGLDGWRHYSLCLLSLGTFGSRQNRRADGQ